MNKKEIRVQLSEALFFDMVYVEGGAFMMGDKDSKYDFEKPAHLVKVDDFYLAKYQFTQDLWKRMMGENPSHFKGQQRPVEMVSWNDTQVLISKLNENQEYDFRLPSEVEWEYAARGGVYSQGYVYSGSDKLSQVAWYGANSNDETHGVGEKLANELGTYDMSGNVYEWCEDDYHGSYNDAPDNGSAWIDSPRGAYRVFRGGGSFFYAEFCRPVCRNYNSPDYRYSNVGFRLAISLQLTGGG